MTLKEKKELLLKLGLPKDAAQNCLQDESDIWAVLPAFRLLKPLNDRLEFFRGQYKDLIDARIQDGTLAQAMPSVAPLVEAGASSDSIQALAYDLTLSAFESLLYQLDDHEGAEVSEVFCDKAFSESSHAGLCEVDPDGNPTGRRVIEVHGMLPFSDLF